MPCDHAWSPRRSQALSDPQRARRPLSEPARRLWEDAADRSSALATIAAAARADGPDELVAAFDAAVTEGMAALGFARVEIVPSDYTYCVAAYRALAASIGVEADRVWRDLWTHPAGRVRAALPGVVGSLLGREVDRLLVVGDQLFSDRRLGWTPDPAELARSWALVLR